MVCDDTDGNVVLIVHAVGFAGDFDYLIEYLSYSVNLEHIVNALHYASETLQTHAGIDILMLKLGVSAVAHVIELREYVVPDFHVSVAVAAGLTVGFAAAVLFTAVEVNLGAGSARSGAVFPEVVFLAEAGDSFRGNADFLIPDFKRFVVVFVN